MSCSVAVDLKPTKLAMARARGATHALDGAGADLAGAIRAIAEAKGPDKVIETPA